MYAHLSHIFILQLNVIYKVLNIRSTSFSLHGTKITNCSVTKAKVIVVRENEGRS